MKPLCISRTAVSFSSNTRAATSAGRGHPPMTPLPPESAGRCGSSVSTQNTCSFSSKTAATRSFLRVSCREPQHLRKYLTIKSTCCSLHQRSLALLEAGGAQFVYLVLFSYAFFSEGSTGLAVTIGAIVTLFVVMQLTARLSWVEKFSGRRVSATSADGR